MRTDTKRTEAQDVLINLISTLPINGHEGYAKITLEITAGEDPATAARFGSLFDLDARLAQDSQAQGYRRRQQEHRAACDARDQATAEMTARLERLRTERSATAADASRPVAAKLVQLDAEIRRIEQARTDAGAEAAVLQPLAEEAGRQLALLRTDHRMAIKQEVREAAAETRARCLEALAPAVTKIAAELTAAERATWRLQPV